MRPQVMHVNYRKDHPQHRAQLAIWATAVGPWLRGICLSADVRTFDPSVQGPGGEDALTVERTEYVVDTYGMARDQVVETNRFVLRLIAPNASSFETDVPLQGNRLPPSVLESARRLSTYAKNAFGEPPYYGQTVEVSSLDAETWTAYAS